MNKKILFPLLALYCLVFPFSTNAQHPKFKISSVTMDDLTMQSCSIDSTAPAFVFFDKGDIEFIPGDGTFDVLYNRILRIKILKKAGIKYGELTIPIYLSKDGTKTDKLREISGITYNLVNGKMTSTRIDPKTIYEQKVSDYLMITKFAFPDVHEGSVLEIKYEIRSPFKFRLNDWEFQNEIPVLHSECILKYTPFFLYTYLLKNATRFDEYEEYQVDGLEKEFYSATYKEGLCRFVMNNIPAFTETDFVSSDKEYMIKLHFQLNKVTDTRGVSENQCSTWDELAETLTDDDSFGKYITASQGVSKEFAEDEKLAGIAPAARFDSIVSWVKNNFSWDEHQRMFTEHKAKDLFKRKTGSSAEINLFLCGMLKAAGIEAYPVLISTRGNEKVVKDYPFLGFFNYVIVAAKIDDKWVLTDGTEPFCANNTFPSRCINGNGLLVKGKKTNWVEINPRNISSREDRIRMNFTPGIDSLEVHVTTLAKGYDGLKLRRSIGTSESAALEYYADLGLEGGDSVTITNASADSVSKPYIIKMVTKIPVVTIDQLPEIDPFCSLAVKKNPFEKTARKYPVDVNYPKNITLLLELKIPPGYRLKKVPEAVTRDNDLMTFTFISQASEEKIMLKAVYSIKNSVYPAEAYKKLKEFYLEIVSKLNEKIYLEKN